MGMCAEKTRKSDQEKQYLLAAKPGRRSASVDCRGRGAEQNVKKKMFQGNRSTGDKARTEPDNRELLEAGTAKQEGRGQREPTSGLESQHGTANVGRKGALTVRPMVDNVRAHHGSNSWNASLLSDWG